MWLAEKNNKFLWLCQSWKSIGNHPSCILKFFIRHKPYIILNVIRINYTGNKQPTAPDESKIITGIILGMGSTNERRCYYVTPPLIGRAHTKNDAKHMGHSLWVTLSGWYTTLLQLCYTLYCVILVCDIYWVSYFWKQSCISRLSDLIGFVLVSMEINFFFSFNPYTMVYILFKMYFFMLFL